MNTVQILQKVCKNDNVNQYLKCILPLAITDTNSYLSYTLQWHTGNDKTSSVYHIHPIMRNLFQKISCKNNDITWGVTKF